MYTVVTHDGGFHPDDVFGVATLQLKFGSENISILRTRSQAAIDAADIVLDVGGIYDPAARRFDHHQPGAPVRENGIPYAAFGLLWREFGVAICGDEAVATKIEESLVQGIDAGDNGVSIFTLNEYQIRPYDIDAIISSYLPPWGSDTSPDETFMDAVTFARELLTRIIKRTQAKQVMKQIAIETYDKAEDKSLLIFDVPMSRGPFIDYEEVKVLIYPSDSNKEVRWNASGVPIGPSEFKTRVEFPEAWAGLRDEELQQVSGITDARFCHKNRYLFVAGSKGSAIRAAEIALGR